MSTCISCGQPLPLDAHQAQKTCNHYCANSYNGRIRKEKNDQLRSEGKVIVKSTIIRNLTSGVAHRNFYELGLCKDMNKALTETLKKWEDQGRIPKQILNKY